jgi:serine/threonine protein kinase
MTSDIIGEDAFRDVATGLLQDLAGIVLPGSHTAMALAPHVSRAFFRVLQRYRESDRPGILDAVARLPFAWAFGAAAKEVAAAPLDEATKRELIKYLAAVPMTARQALHRFDDGGRVTTLLSQLPRSPEEMIRFVPLRPPRFQPGDKVAGYDYRLETLLGQGGFAEVWKARNTTRAGQPPVALKFCLDPALLPSLKREIEMLDRLPEGDSGKDFVQLQLTAYSAEPPFLVYEYIDGGNLAGWLESFEGKPPPPAEVLSVLKMAARAVAVAHDRNIVHRDLKPANLLVTREGRVKVGDFGIGMVAAGSADDSGAPVTNPTFLHHAHTPAYADPLREQAARPGPRDDVYALGVIGYQLLVGSVTARMEGGWRRYLAARGAPADLAEVIDTCVAPPAERYRDAGALLAALEHCGGETRAEKPRPKRQPKAEKPKVAKPQPAPSAAAKFCHRCGTRLQPGRRFCTGCGQRLADA